MAGVHPFALVGKHTQNSQTGASIPLAWFYKKPTSSSQQMRKASESTIRPKQFLTMTAIPVSDLNQRSFSSPSPTVKSFLSIDASYRKEKSS